MKLKKNKCYIIGWIDHNNQYYLDNTLQPCFNDDDLRCAIVGNIDKIKSAKSTFVLESIKEKSIRPGYKYYYLFDTFGAGLRDAPLHKYNKSYVTKNVFDGKSKTQYKKLFNYYWDLDNLDLNCKDQRCCFKLIPIKLVINETEILVPHTQYNISLK